MTANSESGFSRVALLGVVVFGFVTFVAMLYFIAAGDTGNRDNDGAAHAAANGLNGFSGLAQLLELEGYEVSQSRSPSGLETFDLLVLTPPLGMEAEELEEILDNRALLGPTLVILPKWSTIGFPPDLPDEVAEEIEEGWVRLGGTYKAPWFADLAAPYDFDISLDDEADENGRWSGFGREGQLPTNSTLFANTPSNGARLVTDGAGNTLALWVESKTAATSDGETWAVTFVVEPDLLNNYGLADRSRAALALALVEDAAYDEAMPIVFDLTLNGLGLGTNLLTLAFRPPFLAATLCLILAMMIIGWRAFQRFGPPAAQEQSIAFGKDRLVSNGAGLIVRAGRMNLLTAPYSALAQRRLSAALGLKQADPAELDTVLQNRLGEPAAFSRLAADLTAASTAKDIIRAARALKELEGRLSS